jgi:hypothetical protein
MTTRHFLMRASATGVVTIGAVGGTAGTANAGAARDVAQADMADYDLFRR